MLKALLTLMADGTCRTSQELATALTVPLPLVEQMLAQLADNGYITASAACPEGCSGCALAQTCAVHPAGGLRFWTLTAKGISVCEAARVPVHAA